MFGHKELPVISQIFWVTFAFDSSLSIFLQSKSSFESYLVNLPRIYAHYLIYMINYNIVDHIYYIWMERNMIFNNVGRIGYCESIVIYLYIFNLYFLFLRNFFVHGFQAALFRLLILVYFYVSFVV